MSWLEVEPETGLGGVDALEVFSRLGLGTGQLSGALVRMRVFRLDMALG